VRVDRQSGDEWLARLGLVRQRTCNELEEVVGLTLRVLRERPARLSWLPIIEQPGLNFGCECLRRCWFRIRVLSLDLDRGLTRRGTLVLRLRLELELAGESLQQRWIGRGELSEIREEVFL
jgi:hypothetical protein